MSSIALISDTHAGVRNDTQVFYDYSERFFRDMFFPELRRRGIRQVLHLGDLFDRRKYVNFQTLSHWRKTLFEPLQERGIQMKVVLGNHDVYWKTTNRLTSVMELVGKYDNLSFIADPCETSVFGVPALVLPWINIENYAESMRLLTESTRRLVFGHLEINGFHRYRGSVCDHGLDSDLFSRFDKVFTGHFHHRSVRGPVHYVGAPYEMIYSDYDDPRGFHILDTDTLEVEYVKNPEPMFYRIEYDDSDGETPAINPTWKDKYVRVIVKHKKDAYLYDQFMRAADETQPYEITAIEDPNLDIDAAMKEQEDPLIIDDTPSILSAYVDKISVDVNRPALKKMLMDLYLEAVAMSGKE